MQQNISQTLNKLHVHRSQDVSNKIKYYLESMLNLSKLIETMQTSSQCHTGKKNTEPFLTANSLPYLPNILTQPVRCDVNELLQMYVLPQLIK